MRAFVLPTVLLLHSGQQEEALGGLTGSSRRTVLLTSLPSGGSGQMFRALLSTSGTQCVTRGTATLPLPTSPRNLQSWTLHSCCFDSRELDIQGPPETAWQLFVFTQISVVDNNPDN